MLRSNRFPTRFHTYRTLEQAKRAFYKWCCKEGLCGNLIKITEPVWTIGLGLEVREEPGRTRTYYRRVGGAFYNSPWRYGMPTWRPAGKSEAMRQWEAKFDRHWQTWLEEDLPFEQRERAAEARRRDLRDSKSFFRLMDAAAKISRA